jgi:hypothetical protein
MDVYSDSKSLVKRALEVFLVLCIAMLLLAPRWLGYFTSTSSLNQLDTDYLYHDAILSNTGHFANILITGVVEKVATSFGILINLSRGLTGLGVGQGQQLIAFFVAQLAFGVVGVWLTMTSLQLSRVERLLVFALFAFSFFSQFGRYIGGPGFYNKVTASCISIGIGFVVVGLFIQGRYLASVTLAALMAYVHPIYSAVFLLLNFSFALKTWRTIATWNRHYVGAFMLVPAAILVPLAWDLLESQQFLAGQTVPLWWQYLEAKTSNPFPLQDGFIIVVPSIAIFCITFHLLGRLSRGEACAAFLRAQWVVAVVIAAWIIQIVFTEFIPVSFIAKLSLTRMTPFALLFMVIVYVRITWRHRGQDETGLWLLLLLLPVVLGPAQMFSGDVIRLLFGQIPLAMTLVGGWWPDFSIFPEALLLFLLLLALARRVNVSGQSNVTAGLTDPRRGRIGAATAIALLTLVVVAEAWLLIVTPNLRGTSTVVAGAALLLWVGEQRFGALTVCRRTAGWARENSVLVGGLLVFAVAVHPGVSVVKRLVDSEVVRSDADRVWDYLENHTEPNEMVLVVPLFETRRFPVMPLRPVFVDWADGQFVLYDPRILESLIHRLSLIGMDVDRALQASNCAGLLQYVDAMCKRKLFESLSKDYSDAWRSNLPELRRIAPNLSYVLLENKHLALSDVVVFRSGNFSLIKL